MTETDTNWIERLSKLVRGAEFYGPDDLRNPAKGFWVVLGPTSEMTTSDVSIEHAAMVFLANVCKDADARAALGRPITQKPPPP